METNTVSPLASAAANSVSSGSSGTTTISSDFDTFLRMLTVQLQNQDPLNPIDSSDYAVQLATFSGVEQQVQTNDLLRGIQAENSASSLGQMASWVGMEARAAAPAYWDGTPLTFNPKFADGASRAQLLVRDANGLEVQRLDISISEEPIIWAGTDANGIAFPSGTYRFDVVSYNGDAAVQEDQVEVYNRVTEVRLENGTPALVLAGGETILSTEVTALRE